MCVVCLPRYMPDLLDLKVVGRIPKARRARLNHLLQNESPAHTYQSSVFIQKAPKKA